MKIREHRNGRATAGGPGELLAAIPHLMGFHPQSSMVVVHVDLEERRTGTLLRLDLPSADDDHDSYAMQLATRIEHGQPDGVILVCYGDSGGGPPGVSGAPRGVSGAPPRGGGGAQPRAALPVPSRRPDDGEPADPRGVSGAPPGPGRRPGGAPADPPGAAWPPGSRGSTGTADPADTVGGAGGTAAATRGELPYQAMIELVLGELAGGPVEVLGTAYVDGGRWWTYDCDHPGRCPSEGVPLPGPGVGAAADVAARAALAGRRTLSSRRELEDSLRGPSGADEEAMVGLFERVDRELAAEALAEGVEVLRGRTLALARLLLARSAEGRLELSDDDVARLSLGAADLLLRDRFIAFDDADPAAWLGLLTALARRTPDSRAAAICGVVAWVAYQQGDGAVANVAIERVLSVDPGHTMALLLRDCLDGQVSPGHIAALTREAVSAAERARKEVSAAGAA